MSVYVYVYGFDSIGLLLRRCEIPPGPNTGNSPGEPDPKDFSP